jgi:hypothetical protein
VACQLHKFVKEIKHLEESQSKTIAELNASEDRFTRLNNEFSDFRQNDYNEKNNELLKLRNDLADEKAMNECLTTSSNLDKKRM